jgi:hypothetical protein
MSTEATVARLMGLADAYAGKLAYSLVYGAEDKAREALRAALVEALDLGEPAAWLLRPKVQRNPQRPIIRGCYVGARTKQDFDLAELDGDEYIPLYAPKAKP